MVHVSTALLKIVLSTYVVPGNIFTRVDATAEQPYNRGWEDARLRAHFKYPDVNCNVLTITAFMISKSEMIAETT